MRSGWGAQERKERTMDLAVPIIATGIVIALLVAQFIRKDLENDPD
jgi:hypothetical protein